MSKKIKLLKTLALALAISSLGAIAPNAKANAAESYWKSINNNWYYMDSTGKAQTGWVQDNGYWYYIGSNGVMKTGWIQDGGNWYYLWSNGQMAKNTTIGGYYVNSSGAWTTITSSLGSSELTGPNITGQGHRRGDIASSDNDNKAAAQLTNHNLALSDNDLILVKALSINLAQGKTSIDEARANCIGKSVGGKYRITDIKFFDQSFSVTTGTSTNEKIKAIQNSSLAEYKSSSAYKYDGFLVFSCGNSRDREWEAMRVIMELEAV